MKRLLRWNDQATTKKLEKSLENDAISLVSTDTVLGFLARLSVQSFQKLNDLKGGRSQKPYLIVVNNSDRLKLFVDSKTLTEAVERVIKHCWPGPVTFVFRARPDLAPFLQSLENTIALRCPKHAGLQEILKHFDGLFSTSANKSGQPVPMAPDTVDADILAALDYIVVDEEGSSLQTLPSTIIDFSGITEDEGGMVKVVREGAYPIEELERIYGSKFKR